MRARADVSADLLALLDSAADGDANLTDSEVAAVTAAVELLSEAR